MARSQSGRYRDRIPLLEQVRDALREGLDAALAGIPHIDRKDMRVKGEQSFLRKLRSRDHQYDNPWTDIEDQVSGRVLVFFSSDIPIVIDALRERWTQVEYRFKRPAADAEFGYESSHQIFVIPEHLKPQQWSKDADMPTAFEVQIRTLFMHAYAEPQHEFGYRSWEDLAPLVRRKLAWIAASAWGADQAYEDARREGETVIEKGG